MSRPAWLGSDPCRLQECSGLDALADAADPKFEDVPDSPVAGKRALSVGAQDSVDSDALAKYALDAISKLEELLVALGYEEDAGSLGDGLADAGFSDDEPDLPPE